MPNKRSKASAVREAKRLNRDREFGQPLWAAFPSKDHGWTVCETDIHGDPL